MTWKRKQANWQLESPRLSPSTKSTWVTTIQGSSFKPTRLGRRTNPKIPEERICRSLVRGGWRSQCHRFNALPFVMERQVPSIYCVQQLWMSRFRKAQYNHWVINGLVVMHWFFPPFKTTKRKLESSRDPCEERYCTCSENCVVWISTWAVNCSVKKKVSPLCEFFCFILSFCILSLRSSCLLLPFETLPFVSLCCSSFFLLLLFTEGKIFLLILKVSFLPFSFTFLLVFFRCMQLSVKEWKSLFSVSLSQKNIFFSVSFWREIFFRINSFLRVLVTVFLNLFFVFSFAVLQKKWHICLTLLFFNQFSCVISCFVSPL